MKPVRPVVSLSGARASFVGPGLDLAPHANAAATVVLALGSPFGLRLGDAPSERVSSAVIPPGAHHHLEATGPMAFVYLDALSDDYAALARRDLSTASAAVRSLPRHDVDAICASLGVPRRAVSDARVARAAKAIRERPQSFLRVEDAARLAGLSPSRFQRLLRREVGVPFRRFRLWQRMSTVARALSAGRTLTHAAHDAGFNSSSHLSTSFRAMFGLRPRDLLRLEARFEIAG